MFAYVFQCVVFCLCNFMFNIFLSIAPCVVFSCGKLFSYDPCLATIGDSWDNVLIEYFSFEGLVYLDIVIFLFF